ncbi:lipid-A-disaccharide synthase [Synergistales bacterium]|nr:lipid-A-disaccharide synthase [Synergistales bacterium]
MSVFVSCGEVSGDIYAADLITELLRARPHFEGEIWGMMGPLGERAGGTAVWSYEELKIMGFVEALPALPRVMRLRRAMIKEILQKLPDAVVVIDSPDFHILLARSLRSAGYKGLVVFLVTPTVWAWREGRVKWLRKIFDLCLPLFSFEHDFLSERGVRSRWVSHPLVDAFTDYKPPDELAARYRGERVVALMPGSRNYGVKNHTDQLISAAKLLIDEDSGLLPVFSISSGLSVSLKRELTTRLSGFETWDGEGRDLMAVSEAVAGVSGTVSVEAMLLKRFMVVIYNVKGLSLLIARALIRTPFISIPNRLTDAPIFPELMNKSPERVVEELHAYLDDDAIRAEKNARMDMAKRAMGPGGAAKFWIKEILEAGGL